MDIDVGVGVGVEKLAKGSVVKRRREHGEARAWETVRDGERTINSRMLIVARRVPRHVSFPVKINSIYIPAELFLAICSLIALRE